LDDVRFTDEEKAGLTERVAQACRAADAVEKTAQGVSAAPQGSPATRPARLWPRRAALGLGLAAAATAAFGGLAFASGTVGFDPGKLVGYLLGSDDQPEGESLSAVGRTVGDAVSCDGFTVTLESMVYDGYTLALALRWEPESDEVLGRLGDWDGEGLSPYSSVVCRAVDLDDFSGSYTWLPLDDGTGAAELLCAWGSYGYSTGAPFDLEFYNLEASRLVDGAIEFSCVAEGPWTFAVEVPNTVPTRTFASDEAFELDGSVGRVATARLSPIGVTLLWEYDLVGDHADDGFMSLAHMDAMHALFDLPVQLVMADGTVVELHNAGGMGYDSSTEDAADAEDASHINFHRAEQLVDVDEVVAVLVDGVELVEQDG
jgi:hypothetical protein